MQTEKRKLIKFSNYSLCVTLPKWVIRELKWNKGDLVNMEVDSDGGTIHISKGKKRAIKTNTEAKNKAGLRW
ncbi:MAG: AbrB/MazE/SpoVT family DNA-binding domain-containing protein [Patescibacteria group bacterium]|jgi:antitoxin component of MazEF toxin-antitoxin module